MLKILIVDDIVEKCHCIRDCLFNGYDCSIDIATSYLSAVDKLRDNTGNKYDLIICDYNLGNESGTMGIGNGKMLKDSHSKHYPACRFILYTAYPELITDPDARAECIPFDHLNSRINREIFYMSLPQTEDEKPQDNPEVIDMGEQFNSKLCDERHEKLDKSIDRLQGVLSRFTFLFVGAIVSSAFAIVLSCIRLATQ